MFGVCFLSCSGFIAVLGNPGTQTGTVTNGNTATKTTMHHGPLGSMCKFKDLRGLYYRVTTGALIIKIGFWGPSYYTYNKEPQNSIGNYLGPWPLYYHHAHAQSSFKAQAQECIQGGVAYSMSIKPNAGSAPETRNRPKP